jgi:hypothetical protein
MYALTLKTRILNLHNVFLSGVSVRSAFLASTRNLRPLRSIIQTTLITNLNHQSNSSESQIYPR